jgi:homoserine kinase
MRFTVKAPASSANLGPGFDAIGLALDLWNEADIETASETSVTLEGPDGPMLVDHENLVLVAMEELAREHHCTLPPLALTLRAHVPVARGLGSSAAAIVIGLIAANELLDLRQTPEQLYQVALRMEGHGDNVGAAIFGGAILAAPGLNSVIRLRQERSYPLEAVVFIPDETSLTHTARAALPNQVPLRDAVFNLAAASSLSIGLLTGNLEAIAAGMHDRLHEPYRAALFPHLEPIKDAARSAGAVGASLSGAGPTVLALVAPHAVDRVVEAMSQAAQGVGTAGKTCALAIAEQGAHRTPAQFD